MTHSSSSQLNHLQRLLSSVFVPALLLCVGFASVAQAQSAEQAFIWTADDAELEWAPCGEMWDWMPEGCAVAVLQGDPAQRNADVFFRLPGGAVVPHHWHTSAERMVLISGALEVDYDDQEPVVMRAGTYAYGPAGLPHVTTCQSAEPCVLFIAFEEPADAVPMEY